MPPDALHRLRSQREHRDAEDRRSDRRHQAMGQSAHVRKGRPSPPEHDTDGDTDRTDHPCRDPVHLHLGGVVTSRGRRHDGE